MTKIQCSPTKNKLWIFKGLKGFFMLSDLQLKGSSVKLLCAISGFFFFFYLCASLPFEHTHTHASMHARTHIHKHTHIFYAQHNYSLEISLD